MYKGLTGNVDDPEPTELGTSGVVIPGSRYGFCYQDAGVNGVEKR